MSATASVFALAVGVAVAWMFAVSRFIEPEMQCSCWGGDPGSDTRVAAKTPKKQPAASAASRTPALGQRELVHG